MVCSVLREKVSASEEGEGRVPSVALMTRMLWSCSHAAPRSSCRGVDPWDVDVVARASSSSLNRSKTAGMEAGAAAWGLVSDSLRGGGGLGL